MTTGTTIGEMITAVSSALPGKFTRVRPIAARVPSTMARTVAEGETIMLFMSALRQASDVKNSSYHCREKPDMGYIRKESALKDRGTMTSTGSMRKTSTRPQKARK